MAKAMPKAKTCPLTGNDCIQAHCALWVPLYSLEKGYCGFLNRKNGTLQIFAYRKS